MSLTLGSFESENKSLILGVPTIISPLLPGSQSSFAILLPTLPDPQPLKRGRSLEVGSTVISMVSVTAHKGGEVPTPCSEEGSENNTASCTTGPPGRQSPRSACYHRPHWKESGLWPFGKIAYFSVLTVPLRIPNWEPITSTLEENVSFSSWC